MHPYLGYPEKYAVIHNGGNPDEFYPTNNLGEYVGHVTWGVGQKKRLDILYEIIKNHNSKLVGFACIIDRSTSEVLIKDKIVSQIRLKIETYKANQLPDQLKKIEPIKPGSRN